MKRELLMCHLETLLQQSEQAKDGIRAQTLEGFQNILDSSSLFIEMN